MRTKHWLALVGVLVAALSISIVRNSGLRSTADYLSSRSVSLEHQLQVSRAVIAAQTPPNCKAVEEKLLINQKILRAVPYIPDNTLAQLSESISKYSAQYGLDPEMLIAIAYEESRFNPKAVSPVGAVGVMQVMPLWVDQLDFISSEQDLFQVDKNVRAGAYIYREYLNMYKGNHKMALLAYNRGPGSIQISIENGENPDNGYPGMVLASYKRFSTD